MKLAIVDGKRCEAEKGMVGVCIGCGQLMIPKCGEIKIKHWAHKSQCECDRWWENETEWHRNWKNCFPVEDQEVRHKDETTGEWHIADVKTKRSHIIEFQHSFLKPEERQSRNNFYGEKLVWVVDGLKRERDKLQFESFLKSVRQTAKNVPLFRLQPFLEECTILKEWSDCKGPVFFDFGSDWPLWCLLPKSSKNYFYILPFQKQDLVALLNGALTKNGQSFFELMSSLNRGIFFFENPEAKMQQQRVTAHKVQQPLRRRQLSIPMNLTRRELYLLRRMGSPSRKFRF